MNASFIWKGGRCLRSNDIWVWTTEIITVRLFTIGTAFFYLVPYNHLSVMCGEKKKVQLSRTSVWKTDSSSFIRKYIIKVLKNTEGGSSNTKDIECSMRDAFDFRPLYPPWESCPYLEMEYDQQQKCELWLICGDSPFPPQDGTISPAFKLGSLAGFLKRKLETLLRLALYPSVKGTVMAAPGKGKRSDSFA